ALPRRVGCRRRGGSEAVGLPAALHVAAVVRRRGRLPRSGELAPRMGPPCRLHGRDLRPSGGRVAARQRDQLLRLGRLPRRRLAYGIWADGLGRVLDRLHQELPDTPLLVAEYGIGTAHDADRAAYLRRGLEVTAEAIGRGVDVRGLFHWTGVDNYEWLHGYG